MGVQSIAVLILAGLAVAAAAPSASVEQADKSAATADCTCRAQGQDYELGALVCLRGPKGPQIARCGTFLNNTSWQFTGKSCVISTPRTAPTLRLTANRPRS